VGYIDAAVLDFGVLVGEQLLGKVLKLEGIITALVTPFTSDGQVDGEAVDEIVEFQIGKGVNGLFPLGTTGMGPAMEPEERKRVADVVVKKANRRVPVIVQVGASDPLISLELARHAEGIGADAVACLTPFYYHPGADSIVDYYKRLTQATMLPVFVYNIPSNTGNNVDANLLLQLSRIRNVVGIKDSSKDFSQLLDYLETVPEGFTVINGTDSYLFSAFCAGVNAGVSATANVCPELFVEMYAAYKANNLDRGRILQMKIHSVRNATSTPTIAPLLEVLKMRGLKSGNVRPPLRQMNATEIANLRSVMGRILPQLVATP
jgi:4-hydroxy-tetrahydrodipicolinate synthase